MPSKNGAIEPDSANACFLPSLDLRDAEMADVSDMMLKTCAWASSRWFMLMRRIITRERSRQHKEREDLGLSKDAQIPYVPQPMTAADAAAAESYESMLRITFGDDVADYARQKFLDAISTGDMRSFKIRIIMLKARDALSGHCIHRFISKSIDAFISEAEDMAGCKPDSSPRRMSRSEKIMKRMKEEAEARRKREQPELPLIWPGDERFKPNTQDIESAKASESTHPPSLHPPKSSSCHEEENMHKSGGCGEEQDDIQKTCDVTVTDKKRDFGERAKRKSRREKVVRKAREYDTVDQILEDIEEGKIVPYESSDEICEDLKSGKISPVEALMFTAAMDRYMPSDEELSDQEIERDIEQELGDMEEPEDLKDECDRDAGEDEDDGIVYEEVEDRRGSKPFSYNPRGFCGCMSGRYSTSGVDWNTDDET